MSFPRRARLTKQVEFARVFRKPRVSTDAWFKVLARMNEGPCPRLGMAVSRRVDRTATGRNRLKRIVRESFRLNHDLNGEAPALDYVVLPRSAAATISNGQLFRSLEKHWIRLQGTIHNEGNTG